MNHLTTMDEKPVTMLINVCLFHGQVHVPMLHVALTKRDFMVATTVGARAAEMRGEDEATRTGASGWMIRQHPPIAVNTHSLQSATLLAPHPQAAHTSAPALIVSESRIVSEAFCIEFFDETAPSTSNVSIAFMRIDAPCVSVYSGGVSRVKHDTDLDQVVDMSVLRIAATRLRLLESGPGASAATSGTPPLTNPSSNAEAGSSDCLFEVRCDQGPSHSPTQSVLSGSSLAAHMPDLNHWLPSPALQAFYTSSVKCFVGTHRTLSASLPACDSPTAADSYARIVNLGSCAIAAALTAPRTGEALVCTYAPRALPTFVRAMHSYAQSDDAPLSSSSLTPAPQEADFRPSPQSARRPTPFPSRMYSSMRELRSTNAPTIINCSPRHSLGISSPTHRRDVSSVSATSMLSDAWIGQVRMHADRLVRLESLGAKLYDIIDSPIAALRYVLLLMAVLVWLHSASFMNKFVLSLALSRLPSPATLKRLSELSSEQLSRLNRRLRVLAMTARRQTGHAMTVTGNRLRPVATPASLAATNTSAAAIPTTGRRLVAARTRLTALVARHAPSSVGVVSRRLAVSSSSSVTATLSAKRSSASMSPPLITTPHVHSHTAISNVDATAHRLRQCDVDAFRAYHLRTRTQVRLGALHVQCAAVASSLDLDNAIQQNMCVRVIGLRAHILTKHAPLAPLGTVPWLRARCEVIEAELQKSSTDRNLGADLVGPRIGSVCAIDFQSIIVRSAAALEHVLPTNAETADTRRPRSDAELSNATQAAHAPHFLSPAPLAGAPTRRTSLMYDFEAVASSSSGADASGNASRPPLLSPASTRAPPSFVSPSSLAKTVSASKDRRRSVRQHPRASLPSSGGRASPQAGRMDIANERSQSSTTIPLVNDTVLFSPRRTRVTSFASFHNIFSVGNVEVRRSAASCSAEHRSIESHFFILYLQVRATSDDLITLARSLVASLARPIDAESVMPSTHSLIQSTDRPSTPLWLSAEGTLCRHIFNYFFYRCFGIS